MNVYNQFIMYYIICFNDGIIGIYYDCMEWDIFIGDYIIYDGYDSIDLGVYV